MNLPPNAIVVSILYSFFNIFVSTAKSAKACSADRKPIFSFLNVFDPKGSVFP